MFLKSPFSLALTLLMARILADDEDLAMASDDLALVAHLLDRRTYLHILFLSVDVIPSIPARPAADEDFPNLPMMRFGASALLGGCTPEHHRVSVPSYLKR